MTSPTSPSLHKKSDIPVNRSSDAPVSLFPSEVVSTSIYLPPASAPDLSRGSAGRKLYWSWLGRRPYGSIFELQETIRQRLRHGTGPERLLLLEHEPVFTLGRNAARSDVRADPAWLEAEGVEVWECNRGGKVTYHGPGQLVGYPIISLNPDRRDVGRYVRDLQEVLIRTLSHFGIIAHRHQDQGRIGVWVGDQKIASIGVHLSRWITIHGFALNVTTHLDHFSGIVACGLEDVAMTSMERCVPGVPSIADVISRIVRYFGDVFERRLVAVGNEIGDVTE